MKEAFCWAGLEAEALYHLYTSSHRMCTKAPPPLYYLYRYSPRLCLFFRERQRSAPMPHWNASAGQVFLGLCSRGLYLPSKSSRLGRASSVLTEMPRTRREFRRGMTEK